MDEQEEIIKIIVAHYPQVQGIYLFGSRATGEEWPTSDIDIALLLPPLQSRHEPSSAIAACGAALADCTRKEVDLVNVRQVSTVFQKEIVTTGRVLYCGDRYALEEFEMLVLSYYQKLNEERQELLADFLRDGRAYGV